jgi:hypothetical protein
MKTLGEFIKQPDLITELDTLGQSAVLSSVFGGDQCF